jgi:hypothetical protein
MVGLVLSERPTPRSWDSLRPEFEGLGPISVPTGQGCTSIAHILGTSRSLTKGLDNKTGQIKILWVHSSDMQ